MPEAANLPLTLLAQVPVPPLLSMLSAGQRKGTVWSDGFIMQLQEHDWPSWLWACLTKFVVWFSVFLVLPMWLQEWLNMQDG